MWILWIVVITKEGMCFTKRSTGTLNKNMEKGKSFEIQHPEDKKKREEGKLTGGRGEGFLDVSEQKELTAEKEEEISIETKEKEHMARTEFYEKIEKCFEEEIEKEKLNNSKKSENIGDERPFWEASEDEREIISQETKQKIIERIKDLKNEYTIESSTMLIENEVVHLEPKNGKEQKENILAKLKKLHEFRDLEQGIIKKIQKTSIYMDRSELDFLVCNSPACIEIPSEMKIWEVLETLRDPSIFNDSFREIGGHYEEGDNKIWVTIGFGLEADNLDYQCSQGAKSKEDNGDTIFPPRRKSVDPKERKILKKPIFFHTHPKNKSNPTGGEQSAKYNIKELSLDEPYIERNILISEKNGESIYYFWSHIYLPEETTTYFYTGCSYDFERRKTTEITDEYWKKQMRPKIEVDSKDKDKIEIINNAIEALKTKEEKEEDVQKLIKEKEDIEKLLLLLENKEKILKEKESLIQKEEEKLNFYKMEIDKIREKVAEAEAKLGNTFFLKLRSKRILWDQINAFSKDQTEKNNEIEKIKKNIEKLDDECKEVKNEIMKHDGSIEIKEKIQKINEDILMIRRIIEKND
jgi:hypothetical protein